MFNLDPGKLLVIAVVAIILLGPDRLPQVARQVGGAWRSFNEFRHRMESEVRSTMPDLPPTSEIARLARSPSALLNHLSNMSPEDEAESTDEKVAGTGDAVDNHAAGPGIDPSEDPVEDEAPDGSFSPPSSGNGTTPVKPLAAEGATSNGTDGSAGPEGNGTAPAAAQPAPGAADGVRAESAVAEPMASRPTAPASSAPEVIVPGDPTLN
jgi:Sec-independent protein translocase protein TatA